MLLFVKIRESNYIRFHYFDHSYFEKTLQVNDSIERYFLSFDPIIKPFAEDYIHSYKYWINSWQPRNGTRITAIRLILYTHNLADGTRELSSRTIILPKGFVSANENELNRTHVTNGNNGEELNGFK